MLSTSHPMHKTVGNGDDHIAGRSIDGFDEVGVEGDYCRAVAELRRTKVLEPILRRFDGRHRHFALATVNGDNGVLGPGAVQIAVGVDFAGAARTLRLEDSAVAIG